MRFKIEWSSVLNAAQRSRWATTDEWPTSAVASEPFITLSSTVAVLWWAPIPSWNFSKGPLLFLNQPVIYIPAWRLYVCVFYHQLQKSARSSTDKLTAYFKMKYRWQRPSLVGLWTCWPWIICFMSSPPSVCLHPSLIPLPRSHFPPPLLCPELRDTSTQGHWQCTETDRLNKGSGEVKVRLRDWKRLHAKERKNKDECWKQEQHTETPSSSPRVFPERDMSDLCLR